MIRWGGAWSREEPEGPYGDEAARIDEGICRLLSERDRLAAKERLHPGADRVRRWSEQFDIGEGRLQSLFANLAAVRQLESQPPMPEGLRRVLEIMRREGRDGVSVTLTHCLQYGNASVIHCEIAAAGRRIAHGSLELEVAGREYRTRHSSGHGGGGAYGLEFIVWPALPDDLSRVTFRLRQGKGLEPPAEPPLELGEPLVFAPENK